MSFARLVMSADISGVEPIKELQYLSLMKNKNKPTMVLSICSPHQLLIQPYKKGESQFTVAFLKYLQAQYPESRIVLIWDGASASIALKK